MCSGNISLQFGVHVFILDHVYSSHVSHLQCREYRTLRSSGSGTGLVSFSGLGWHSQYSDQLQAGWFGDRIPVGARFSTSVQTGPGAHPAFHTVGTRSFARVKWPGHGVNHPPPSSTEVKERVELYLYSRSGPSWSLLGQTLPFSAMSNVLYKFSAGVIYVNIVLYAVFSKILCGIIFSIV